ncbi:MAG: ATP-binding protein, partial [Acidobacteria bacterium]|nr:ATP-binding protein [Acidobacteriota bacterium]
MSTELTDRDKLVKALLECDCMKTAQARSTIVQDLPAEIQQKIAGGGKAIMDIHEIVSICSEFPEGLEKLLQRVRHYEGDSFAWRQVEEAARKPAESEPATVLPSSEPAAPPKPSRLDFEQFEEHLLRREVEEIKVANPYLLGDKFVGREKELSDLTNWLVEDENGILCICDLGGTGKSALAWHWLNSESTRDVLIERGIKQFWCSFYARNYDSIQFLRDLATQLGGAIIDETDTFSAQKKLQQFVLDRLKMGKWLLVLDGLEREMGAFANHEHYQVDSEEQDRRNEKKEILIEERYIRGYVFPDFIRELLKTQTKVLITSRLFPENLKSGDQPLPGVTNYPFLPMSLEDAIEVWNLSGDPDGSPFQQEFFTSVGYHPQVISVVSAAVKEQSLRFGEWFGDFADEDRQSCLDSDAPLTVRRHRWLDLATRDLIQNHRDAWLTICYIVRRSEASNVDTLMNTLVDNSPSDETRHGRFRSSDKLIEVLNYLEKRRLIGT